MPQAETRLIAPRNLPAGRKVNIAWTSGGKRLLGTCWTKQVQTFLDRRILAGSTDIRLRVEGRAPISLGDKP